MNILLIGEFSGVHNNLKKALNELGHNVKIAADGDGFKEFGYDFKVAPYNSKYIGKLKNVVYTFLNIKKYLGYDIVQFINPGSIPYYYYYFGIAHLIFKYNKKKIYYAAGTEPAYINSLKFFDYYPIEEVHYNKLFMTYYKWFLKNINCIVPSMYSYYYGYKDNKKITEFVQLPGKGEYKEIMLDADDKPINIMHGITRKGFKGTDIILNAMDYIKEKYEEKVNMVIVEKLSFNEYRKIYENVDIVIDQCRSYDYGMNAIFALEAGKVVMSGAEDIAIKFHGHKYMPIINIKPDKKQIIEEIEKIINMSPKEVYDLKMNGQIFVKNFHHPNIVARRLLEYYKNH